jgi:hypothetical protein
VAWTEADSDIPDTSGASVTGSMLTSVVASQDNTNNTVTLTVTLAADVTLGLTTMRVMTSYNALEDSCSSPSYGEVEDYGLVIEALEDGASVEATLRLAYSTLIGSNCTAGYYCDATTGAATVCPAGYYCVAGTTFYAPCPVGYYCPEQSSEPTACESTGSVCYEGSVQEYDCPAGYYCPSSLEALACPDGTLCVGANEEPAACPDTFYCPYQNTSVICPAGSVCPTNSSTAYACPIASDCPEGTSTAPAGMAQVWTYTTAPTGSPTTLPTPEPTNIPTAEPTKEPTSKPTTGKPTEKPTTMKPTDKPTTMTPSMQPTTSKPSATPAAAPTNAAVTPTNAAAAPTSAGGFDWGDQCSAGSGRFGLELPERFAKETVGDIPSGKEGVVVYLEAGEDLDVVLYDKGDTSRFPEGKAIVQYCSTSEKADPNQNCGLLGGSREESVEYKGMTITYSGYLGDQKGGKGNEYIKIVGTTSTTLSMGAYAYETGSASVKYEWATSTSDCCKGVYRACGGQFSTTVNKEAIVQIGSIPTGKRDLQVTLTSGVDVDVQLYDTDDVSGFEMGQAIVAYCSTADRNDRSKNCGLLGSTSGAQTATYISRSYAYSGYNGVDGEKGNEYITIEGETNRNLMMYFYGYKAGDATVSYSYTQPLSEERP